VYIATAALVDVERRAERVSGELRGTPFSLSGGECAVCMDAPNTHVLVPCGHKCVCAGCSERIRERGHCPMCRAAVVWTCEVFE